MADLDKVLKGLAHCTGMNGCFECPYSDDGFSATAHCKVQVDRDALELLKQYSGLAKALEQSNAVNEHLNEEIERLKEMQRVDNCERCRFKDKCLTGKQLNR